MPKIQEYYQAYPDKIKMIFQAFSEITLNFWEHALEDSNSIIVAKGDQHNIEITCADTGNGIISTLQSVPKFKKVRSPELLKLSTEKKVTSKSATFHMGYGLWILNEIATRTKGTLRIFSESAYYNNNKGKIRYGECGYWKGTIISITFPLSKIVYLTDLIKPNNNIKINYQ